MYVGSVDAVPDEGGQEDADANEILQFFGQDRLRLAGRIEKTLESLKTGNAGRPTFSESLFQWIEDAWTLASLLYGVSRLRTGHLLLQFAERSSRYTAEEFQAGGGIVHDSQPDAEWEETMNKARAVFRAAAMVEKRAPGAGEG